MLTRQGSGKKLIDAARRWAIRPARSTQADERAADPVEWRAAIEERDETDDENECFWVFPENWQTVLVFVRLRHCWRIDGFTGHYFGIDRSAIESTIRMMGIKKRDRPEIVAKLEIMEDAALPLLNRKK